MDQFLRSLIPVVEAEDARTTTHPVGSPDAVLLERGPVPLGDAAAPLPESNRARRWGDERATERGRAAPEEARRIWLGWPLVTTPATTDGRPTEVHAGLLVGEADLIADLVAVDPPSTGSARANPGARRWRVTARRGPLALNDAALELLGHPEDERRRLHATLDPVLATDVDRAALVRLLTDHGILTRSVDPDVLAPVDHAQPVSGTALVWVGRPETAPEIGPRLADLRALAADSAVSPALRALLDADAATGPPAAATPQPVADPITAEQERAVLASRTGAVTVVTGGPGTGRTRTAVHAVAAALAHGERVLVVTPEATTAAALHRQIGALHPASTPLLATDGGSRHELARTIDLEAHDLTDRTDDRELAAAAWQRAHDRIAPTYAERDRQHETAQDLVRARGEDRECRRALTALRWDDRRLADLATIDGTALTAGLARAEAAGARYQQAGGRRPRQRIERRRLEHDAHQAVTELQALLGMTDVDADRVLRAARALERHRQAADEVRRLEAAVAEGRPIADLDREIDQSFAVRRAPATALIGTGWTDRRQPRAPGRVAARRYQLALAEHAGGGSGAAARDAVTDVVETFPVWVTTAATVSRWLPLQADLFDLVVVDDADRVELAAGLAAVARGPRALLLGTTADDGIAPDTADTAPGPERPAALRPLLDLALDHHEPITLNHRFRPPAELAALPRLLHDGIDDVVTPAGGLEWRHHEGTFAPGPGGRSGRNAAEALAVVELVDELVHGPRHLRPTADTIDLRTVPRSAIGIITPFVAQRDALADLLRERHGDAVKVATPEGFAGLERDVIIVSPVIDPDTPPALVAYAARPEALATAVTRARHQVIVVGDRHVAAESGTALADLVRRASGAVDVLLTHR